MAPVTVTSTGVARQTIDDPNLIALIERLSKFYPSAAAAADVLVDATNTVAGDGDAPSAAGSAVVYVATNNAAGATDGDIIMADAVPGDGVSPATVPMATSTTRSTGESESTSQPQQPPLDVKSLVAELDSVPKWQFQELADLYEWIRPLNAMDAALNYFMDAYPSLLLQQREKNSMKADKNLTPLQQQPQPQQGDAILTQPLPLLEKDNKNPKVDDNADTIASVGHTAAIHLSLLPPPSPPQEVIQSVISILRFQSQLLRNSTSKFVYNSVVELSDLLTSSDDEIASLATETLAALAVPPALHRQQAPEISQHTTALHRSGSGISGAGGVGYTGASSNTSNFVMGKLLGLARGWGTKGTGLGLLQCVTMDDSLLMTIPGSMDTVMNDGDDNNDKVGREKDMGQKDSLDSQKQQAQSILQCAGEISFECYIELDDDLSDSSPWKKGRLVSLYVSKEDMFTPSMSSSPPTTSLSTGQQRQPQAEKRRRIANDQTSNDRDKSTIPAVVSPSEIKSTVQIYYESLDKIATQLEGCDPVSVLSPEQLFTLISSIRLARSFHTLPSRIAAIERRLRALACFVHSNPSQESVCAYFLAQPELCGELVDLLRPTVSSGNIASGAVVLAENGVEERAVGGRSPPGRLNSILALSDSPEVPYTVRTLAIEALTALVARRDGAGTLTNVARQTNVLSELGVGKGQYLGLLPTLIRYSLASLNSFLLQGGSKNGGSRNRELLRNGNDGDRMKELGLELGLAFLKATKAPPLPLKEREERALEFIDSVLTLTSAVISVPSGTASLTDCGIIPALVSSIALDGQIARSTVHQQEPLPLFSTTSLEESYSDCLLKFISAQAIQILEGAIVTHNSALSAFHELKGVDILVNRLSVEIDRIKSQSGEAVSVHSDTESAMDTGDTSSPGKQPLRRKLQAARRVLLFSAVNCLTVVFHQQETGTNSPSSAALSGAAQLRKPELQKVLLEIMENIRSYGGVLAALVATFLSDVMNSDPQVVHHVHSSGLAKSFLSLLMRNDLELATADMEGPILNPSAELIMVVPNVIMALSLTEAGEAAVAEANPFPALMSIFCSPKYVMPNSRCLLNEIAAMIGTGLDEIMRHNPNLRTKCLQAIVHVMKRVVIMGRNLTSEEDSHTTDSVTVIASHLENSRTLLMQYVHNLVQLLEQILHVEDHIAPFVAVGGFESLLELACSGILPGGRSLVAHLTCLSRPSIASATYSTASNTLSILVNTICSQTSDPGRHLKKIMSQLESELHFLGDCVSDLARNRSEDALDCKMLLENVPPVAIYDLSESPDDKKHISSLARLFRSLINVDWLTKCLATCIRTASQKSNEFGPLGGREQEWKKEIDSKSFESIVNRLSLLHRSSLFEICRIRTVPGFDDIDAMRGRASGQPLVYKIRIVCQEGAIVRNGIDIDQCESVGNIEMGEIVHAYDRCINSSGVLRYRTSRGWVSELARGQGRENITEVLDVRIGTELPLSDPEINSKRIECGVPDLRSSAAAVLARLSDSQTILFSSLGRILLSGMRMPQRSITFQQVGIPSHVTSATKLLTSNLLANFDYGINYEDAGTDDIIENASLTKDAAKCMYFGNQLSSLQTSLYEEKREEPRRTFNLPLLVNLLVGDGWSDGIIFSAAEIIDTSDESDSKSRILSAIQFVLVHSLRDMDHFATMERARRQELGIDRMKAGMVRNQRMSRAVASSLLPTLSLLRKLVSRPLLVESQAASAMTKMNGSDLESLITNLPLCASDSTSQSKFSATQFTRALHLNIAQIVQEIWSDGQFVSVPSHVMHPWIQLMGEVFQSLEGAGKVDDLAAARDTETLRDLSGANSRSGRILASMGLLQDPNIDNLRDQESDPFEPSEDSIDRLQEMGFDREHAIEALESAGTNQVEIAMEYALLRPPPSPATLERRRALRQEQRSLEHQRQNESLPVSASNGEPSSNDSHIPSLNALNDSRDELKTNSLSNNDARANKEKESEEKLASKAEEYLEMMKESSCRISLNIVESCDVWAARDNEKWQPHNACLDSQGVVIVITNFLLDNCRLYPSLDSSIGSELLRRLKLCLENPRKQSKDTIKLPSHCQVRVGHEAGFAALVHTSVVFFRALPKLRPLVLRHGIVGMISHCIRNCTLATSQQSGDTESRLLWPVWLAPAILLLEVMATPTSIILDDEVCEEGVFAKSPNKRSEYGKVLAEHKNLQRKQVSTLKHVFTTVMHKDAGKMTPRKIKDSGENPVNDAPAGEESKRNIKAQSATLPQIPPFLPLLHSDTQEACMMMCLQLIGLKTRKGVIDRAHQERVCPPPIILNSLLLLMVRLLRSRHLSSLCLQRGGADLLLRLPGCSFFPGNRHIISLALRRMLEDEVTLHAMMETEIRGVVTKVYRKQHPSLNASDQPKVSLKTFMRAIAPLACRDPSVFVKAIATSVKIDSHSDDNSSSRVTLLSTEDRVRNMKLLGLQLVRNVADASATENHAMQGGDQLGRMMKGRGKPPHQLSTAKSPAKSISKNHFQVHGTPANHISLLLLNEIMSEPQIGDHVETFLKPTDYLDILSDLVLAAPACGAALLRYKPKKGFCNAISGCPDPPQTAVSYILHKLLPLPRLIAKQDLDSGFNTDIHKARRLQAFSRTKISQAGARLIVCLMARSGDGRRCVVADLVFALSCGSLPVDSHAPTSMSTNVSKPESSSRDAEMWAISTWGDLVYGLSAPRCNNNSLISQDMNSVLSFGVVKLMMEHDVAHALMAAIERIDLHHPMASSVASSVIRALEIYSRGSVVSTVNEMQLRETEKSGKISKESQHVSSECSQRSETQMYDAVLEDEFASRPARHHRLEESTSLGESVENSSDDDVDDSMDEDSDGSSEIEVRLGNVDYSDDSNEDESSSGEDVSSEGSSDDGDESIEDSDGEVVDDGESLLGDETEEDEVEEEVEGEEESHEDFLFDADADDEAQSGLDQEAEAGNEIIDDGLIGRGWTRIDNNDRTALGSMLMEMVQPHNLGRHQHLANGGFLVNAAETMRNILRGDLGIDGLSEFEDSLGMRLLRADRGDGRISSVGLSAGLANRAITNGLAGSGRPTVQIINSGVIASRNRHLSEMSPMEAVFGAPFTGVGSQDQNSIVPLNEVDIDRDSDVPQSFDTHLFPGGVPLSTQSTQALVGSGSLLHPLVQSLSLPPATSITSLVSTLSSPREGRNSMQDRSNVRLSAGSYTVDANGSLIRDQNRAEISDSARVYPSMLNGSWADDGLPLDEFSTSFEQALGTFLRDQTNSQNRTSMPDPRGQTESLIQNQEADDNDNINDVDAGGSPAEENMVDHNEDTGQSPILREAQSETAEVSCAMATGLTISQPALENSPHPTNNMSDHESNDAHPVTDGAEIGNVAVLETGGGAEELAQEDDAVPDANAHELNEDIDPPTLRDNHEAPEEIEFTCPPDIDPDVFRSLPPEMQQEIIHQQEVAAQISESGLDPEALAALPEDLRREVIEEEQNQQRLRDEQASRSVANPAIVEEMDNASFLASLAPDLRQEILLTADDEFISTLPVTLIAEANVLRERVASQQRQRAEGNNGAHIATRPTQQSEGQPVPPKGRRQRNGKLRIECDRDERVWIAPLLTTQSAKSFLSLLYLLSPIQPQRIVHKLMLNLCLCDKSMRDFFLNVLLGLLRNERQLVLELLEGLDSNRTSPSHVSSFPPTYLIGSITDMADERSLKHTVGSFRRRQVGNSVMTVAASLPTSARGSSKCDCMIPPVVARRMISCISSLCKASPRVAFSMLLRSEDCADSTSCLDKLLDLLEMDQYSQSASNLEQLLGLLEIVVAPLSLLPRDEQEIDLGAEKSSPGKEWVKVPRVVVSRRRLHLLINLLANESCKESSFLKVNTLARRLSRIETNRESIIDELATVAEALGRIAILDLKAVGIRLSSAAENLKQKTQQNEVEGSDVVDSDIVAGTNSSAVSLSTSNSETKLLRVLQMLTSLCVQDDEVNSDGNSTEFVSLLQSLKLESLWKQLESCLKTVSVLEGVANLDSDENEIDGSDEHVQAGEMPSGQRPKLQNSIAGLITRFLPAIEAFFMVNTPSHSVDNGPGASEDSDDNRRVVQFAASNKILLNALLRSNPLLLEKGLRAMIKIPKCRMFLDFDVKRAWFKSQLRRVKQQASRRHGSLRLSLRRKHVFEDSFHAFTHRTADELRGRLHVSFQDEDGVDAGGLSREFFAILAIEMFNPNYALFMSTEDGCTFQPNPNSSINPDDLRYFRFVGRIVGKAVVDGFLLDAHFTRSLYKHILGVKPTHHDMQAIDPDYYKNLQMIMEHNLEDIGLELTFSVEDHSFGRSQTIDLIPGGRKIPVTEDSKQRYVELVCQHRMTTAIEKQIKAFLEGFHEIVDKQLISIFNARELELLISGLPDIDIHDLKKNTEYNGYRPADKEIVWFWNILFSLTRSEKAAFLQFATGSSKVPLAGFSELPGMRGVQKFSICKASGPAGALMSAHTCFNALDLPVYNSEEEMREKLLYAINEGSSGFGFA